jgi:hypothetical protein
VAKSIVKSKNLAILVTVPVAAKLGAQIMHNQGLTIGVARSLVVPSVIHALMREVVVRKMGKKTHGDFC